MCVREHITSASFLKTVVENSDYSKNSINFDLFSLFSTTYIGIFVLKLVLLYLYTYLCTSPQVRRGPKPTHV